MKDLVLRYIADLQQAFQTGQATEHSYRPALRGLFEGITKLRVVNEPKGSAHGRPDFIFVKGDIPIAWAEAKDLHINLDKIEKSEQMERYFGYSNLILTNGLEFRLFQNGQRYGDSFVLAEKHGGSLSAKHEAFEPFVRALIDLMAGKIDTIRSAEHLAKIMGGKAQRLRDNIIAMFEPSFTGNKEEIEKIMQVMKQRLIHDLSIEQFADLYAQTLVYGLFVARFHDDTPTTFSRAEAREKIPASNHLLQQFFDHIAGANFEKRLSFIVDELCDVFVHADVNALVHGLYKSTHDPIIHFYEDFLREYDPKLRVERGVFYTPLPVVRYIVRSIDALLKEHFGLNDGLADRSKIDWQHTVQGKKVKTQIDRVQMLDPAVGTGTFLDEVVRTIHSKFANQQGAWQQFVDEHLIPRLNGFELMMASYTIAHLKLSMTLAESGVKDFKKRLRIFLTNSLEEAPQTDDSLFSLIGLQGALTEEAQAAAEVKRDYPIMVVLGNPPYSASSQNASVEIGPDGKKHKTWIGQLLDDYKKDLNERKINLDDDYIKFIRFAHHMVEKNGQGIVAMITNNSFIDGITHRKMRESLLETFDHIYVLDLHGNSKRKEKALDGGKDENVFDIMQGVGITLFVKTKVKKKHGTVHHIDLYGKREEKYSWLDAHDVTNTKWQKLEAPEPYFFFVPKDFRSLDQYDRLIKLDDLFPIFNSGVKTDRDPLFLDYDKAVLSDRIQTLLSGNFDEKFREQFDVNDSSSYKITTAIINKEFNSNYVSKYCYRPLDFRWIYFDPQIISRSANSVMKHLVNQNNIAIASPKQTKEYPSFFITKTLASHKVVSAYDQNFIFPLYLYPDQIQSQIGQSNRKPNLNPEIIAQIAQKVGLRFVDDGMGDGRATFGPEDVLDYIYGVLHSPTYREKYKEFLKIDFPRVPFTEKLNIFWKLVGLGRELRGIHLLESPIVNKPITTYPVSGDNVVDKPRFEGGKVWINKFQHFDKVPEVSWNFYIGGYQPAQKWPKDRKGRALSFDDIMHYQKIIVALTETDRIMKEVDAVTKDWI
jgi:predicted helicase